MQACKTMGIKVHTQPSHPTHHDHIHIETHTALTPLPPHTALPTFYISVSAPVDSDEVLSDL